MTSQEGTYKITCNGKTGTIEILKLSESVFRNGYSNWDGTKWVTTWMVKGENFIVKDNLRKSVIKHAAQKVGGVKLWDLAIRTPLTIEKL